MTSTDDIDVAQRARLTTLTRALRDLHKHLIDVETQYFGAVGSPLEHLQLIVNHPHFAWLQKMSTLMAEIDERLDQPEIIDNAQSAAFRGALEHLIGPGETGDTEFRSKYNALLQDSPNIAMTHGAVRKLLAGIVLPKAA